MPVQARQGKGEVISNSPGRRVESDGPLVLLERLLAPAACRQRPTEIVADNGRPRAKCQGRLVVADCVPGLAHVNHHMAQPEIDPEVAGVLLLDPLQEWDVLRTG